MINLILTALTGFLVRMFRITESFWHDEAIGISIVERYSLQEIISNYLPLDNHPPLYYLTLDIWTNIFGYSELWIRLLSVFLGIGTIVLVYYIYQEISGKKSVLASLLLAISPLFIYFTQEARMYSMAAFFTSLAVLFFLRTFGKHNPWNYLWFAVGLLGMFFSDYMPVFMYPVFIIFAIIRKQKWSWWKWFLLSHIPLLVFGVMWIPILLQQLSSMSQQVQVFPMWKQLVGGFSIKHILLLPIKMIVGMTNFENKNIYYGMVLVASIPYVYVLAKGLNSFKKNILVWLWLLVPPALAFIVSSVVPVFNFFRFIYILPAFALLLAVNAKNENFGKLSNYVIPTLLIIPSFFHVYYQTKSITYRENWKQAVQDVESRIKDDEIVLLEYPHTLPGYYWYSQKKDMVLPAITKFQNTKEEIDAYIPEITKNVNGIYYFEYLRDVTDPQRLVERVLLQEGFQTADILDGFSGVGQVTYFKRK